MDSLDLNIDNYNLSDILSLFHLPTLFNEDDLKRAKLTVLKTHPDKSQLPKEYFLFFTKAYRILHQIYTVRHPATDEHYTQRVEKNTAQYGRGIAVASCAIYPDRWWTRRCHRRRKHCRLWATDAFGRLPP